MGALKSTARRLLGRDQNDAIIEGIGNQTRVLNERLQELIVGLRNQTTDTNNRLDRIIAELQKSARLPNR